MSTTRLVLALNCGSSSLKAALFELPSRRRILDAHAQELGTAKAVFEIDGARVELPAPFEIEAALEGTFAAMHRALQGRTVDAIAHRLVHGGERFVAPIRIDDANFAELSQLASLAPLHNPAALKAVKIGRAALAQVPHVAVFDTAFHATLPAHARLYALPADLSARNGLRRFGFHGLSHGHVCEAVAEHLRAELQELRVISCHLGNGASVTAIEGGRSVETSMGMTPLEGLVMGTRAGDLDPGVLLALLSNGFDHAQLEQLLNRNAGLKGLTGTNDMREIEERAAAADEACRSAIALYTHRIRKYIGAYAAVMGGVDVIAFMGGVGENSALIRAGCLQRLDFLGAVLDENRNRNVNLRGQSIQEISADQSRVRMFVVKADEELALARAVARVRADWGLEAGGWSKR